MSNSSESYLIWLFGEEAQSMPRTAYLMLSVYRSKRQCSKSPASAILPNAALKGFISANLFSSLWIHMNSGIHKVGYCKLTDSKQYCILFALRETPLLLFCLGYWSRILLLLVLSKNLSFWVDAFAVSITLVTMFLSGDASNDLPNGFHPSVLQLFTWVSSGFEKLFYEFCSHRSQGKPSRINN